MRRLVLVVSLVACQRNDAPKKIDLPPGSAAAKTGSGATAVEQVKPPIDIKVPPADAVKTSTGLVYKKIKSNPAGASPGRNDTVLINYTGWKHASGETFFTNRTQGQPMPLSLATTAPGFTEAIQVVKKGETVMLWMPPDIGYPPQTPKDQREELVYEVEIVDIVPAPAVPADLAQPPADAKVLPSGVKYVVVKPGETEKPHAWDTVTFDYTAWDATGRMFDSTEMRKRPATVPPFRQSAVMEEILTTAAKGERVRFWVDSEKLAVGGRPSGLPEGQLCYELQIASIENKPAPPPVPPDVKAPPPNAKKTSLGVFYRVLAPGKSKDKPQPTDTVTVNYTGWSTDGRMFDSSAIGGKSMDLALDKAIKGWGDAIPLMTVGTKFRLWIPEELAYKGQAGRPQGMLVFDVELLATRPTTPVESDDPHAGAAKEVPPPKDVAAPPKDAKKSPKGVFYKLLAHGKPGAPHPKATDTIRVNYTGWTTDGKMFDSSVTRGVPLAFSLTQVIPGWTDAFQVLSVGDKARLWIPQELAYQGMEGSPAGMLVFDVELLEIVKAP